MISALLLLITAEPRVEADVTYATVAGTELKLDLYYPPEGAPKTEAAVVVIHGGAWMGGTRKDMRDLSMQIAKRGMLAASVQYRLAPKSIWPAMLDDVQTATRYLRTNASKLGFNPNRIGATGASAGGHLAVFLGSRETRDLKPEHFPGVSSRAHAVFDIFGPTDMTKDFPANLDVMFQLVLGKPKAEASEAIRDASPINFINKDTAPTFIYQGLADPLVHPNQSRYLEDKLKSLGIPVQAVYLKDVQHNVPVENPKVREAVEQGIEWLATHLTKRN